MSLKPVTMGFVAPVCPATCDPTIEGTCMRRPALTKRTKTDPEAETPAAGETGNNEAPAAFPLNATPLMR